MNEERTEDRTKDWPELCKAAANELDPAKLMELIGELTRALDERDKRRGKVNDPGRREKHSTSLTISNPIQHAH
jgi:hypothetical protein